MTNSLKKIDSEIFRLVKSRLFPLPPFVRFLESVIEQLPRRFVQVHLDPFCDVAILDGELGEYKATGERPSFSLELTPELVQGGWFYLEAALVRHTGDREARLYGLDGDGFEIPIPSNLRGTVREVFFLSGSVSQLYWSPMNVSGFFSQSPLLLHRISPLESFLRRAHRVILSLWNSPGTQSEEGRLTWQSSLRDLHGAYLATAWQQIRRYGGHDYPSFIAAHDTVDVATTRGQLSRFESGPQISLMMVVREGSLENLQTALQSLKAQVYPHWELVVVGESTECLTKYQDDPRFRFVPSGPHQDTAARLNQALEQVRGDYVGVMGQQDVLPAHALFYLAQTIHTHPEAVLIYTDHDTMNEQGQRCDPCFKPDWNPDYFTAYDYMGDLRLYRAETLRGLQGFRTGFEGAEAYDLALRCIKVVAAEQVRHLPRILYHRRAVESATPEAVGTAHESGLRALSDYWAGTGSRVESGAAQCLYRIRHPIPDPPPLVSILIPTRDKLEVLQACVESVRQRTDYPAWEILIVDNLSCEPGTLEWLIQIQQDPRIRVIVYPEEFNYSAINNFAVEHARGDILVLLNNDIEVIDHEWLTEMVGHAVRPHIGAVGAKLLYPNGMVQHAGVVLGIGGVAGHVHRYLGGSEPGYANRAISTQNYSVVTAACLAVRKAVYRQVGGLDAVNLRVAFNDVDFCIKLVKAGYRNVFTPHALLLHHESLSRGHDDTPAKKAIFEREVQYMKTCWGTISDPAYNPNLSLEFEDFSLLSRGASRMILETARTGSMHAGENCTATGRESGNFV